MKITEMVRSYKAFSCVCCSAKIVRILYGLGPHKHSSGYCKKCEREHDREAVEHIKEIMARPPIEVDCELGKISIPAIALVPLPIILDEDNVSAELRQLLTTLQEKDHA